MFTKKNNIYIDEINSYKKKLSEYKTKIIILKKKIDELYNKDNKYRKQNIIPLYNYNNEYENNNQKDNYLFKNQNLTPIKYSNKNKSHTVRRSRKSEEFIDYKIDNEENNLQNEQKQFVKDYKIFLDNLKY